MDASEGRLSAPMCRLAARPPCRTLISDGSKHAVGDLCLETGQYRRDDLSEEELARFCGSNKHLQSQDMVCSELLDMVMPAYMLVMMCGERPVGNRNCVLLRGDNEAVVYWVRRCRGGKEPRSGTLMRLMGAIELAGGWHFDSPYIPGVLNDVADGISR